MKQPISKILTAQFRAKIPVNKKVSYRHLVGFAADYKAPSIHVTKSRVLTLRQFYHFAPFNGSYRKILPREYPIQKSKKPYRSF